jgi:hypothetical protein
MDALIPTHDPPLRKVPINIGPSLLGGGRGLWRVDHDEEVVCAEREAIIVVQGHRTSHLLSVERDLAKHVLRLRISVMEPNFSHTNRLFATRMPVGARDMTKHRRTKA